MAITRSFDAERLGWAVHDEAAEDGGLGGNLEYIDLRELSWEDASRVLELEGEMTLKIESLPECDPESETFQEELAECERYLFGLDLGVASSVIALSAAGCVPFSSCNAGAFGGSIPDCICRRYSQDDGVRSGCDEQTGGIR